MLMQGMMHANSLHSCPIMKHDNDMGGRAVLQMGCLVIEGDI